MLDDLLRQRRLHEVTVKWHREGPEGPIVVSLVKQGARWTGQPEELLEALRGAPFVPANLDTGDPSLAGPDTFSLAETPLYKELTKRLIEWVRAGRPDFIEGEK